MSNKSVYEPSRQSYTPSLEEQQKLLEGKSIPNPYLTRQQVQWGMDEFFRKIKYLQTSKNEDYATTEDGLVNFRQTAERLGLRMPQVFLTLMQKHQIALENDARRPEMPLNEGVEDRLLDIACYCGLLWLALREETLLKRKGGWGLA